MSELNSEEQILHRLKQADRIKLLESRIEHLEKTETAVLNLSHPNIKLYRDENAVFEKKIAALNEMLKENSNAFGILLDDFDATKPRIEYLESKLAVCAEALKFVEHHLKEKEKKGAYDWNKDELYLTLIQGKVFEVLAQLPNLTAK